MSLAAHDPLGQSSREMLIVLQIPVAQVAANSLVLKAVPPKTMVAGSPAREVGKVTGEQNPCVRWPAAD